MIKELQLKDWKSFGDASSYIDPLTILIGSNGSGKSNILDALMYLEKITSGKELNQAANGLSEEAGIRGGSEWIVRKGAEHTVLTVCVQSSHHPQLEYRYSLAIGLHNNTLFVVSETLESQTRTENEVHNVKKLFFTTLEDSRDSDIPVQFKSITNGRYKKLDLKRSYSILWQSKALSLAAEVQKGIEAVSKSVSNIFILDPIPSHIRGYAKFSPKLDTDGANMAGVLAALPKERKSQVEGILSSYLKRLAERDILRVWTEPVGKFGTDAMLYCEEKWSIESKALTVDTRGMSDGSLRFLAVMVAMLTIEKGSLLMIEEIDNGLHPSRVGLLVEFLKEIGQDRGVDVLCTTHNPALLDAFGNEMIPFISLVYREREGGWSGIRLVEDIENLPRLMARGSIGKLSGLGLLEKTTAK